VSFDYIIVGAGSAGCALASRLSESGDKRILVLEAGPGDGSIAIRIPLAAGLMNIDRFDWGYHSQPDPSRNQKSERWIRGRVVGGTSSINGMNYVRGAASDYDRWAAQGNSGWDSASVLPLFRDIERCDRDSVPPSEIRGWNGALHVRMTKHPHPVTRAFIAAAQAAGHRFTQDYNSAVQEGIGYAQLTQRGRRRWSSADAFLTPALSRKNLRVITGAHVHKLLLQGTRAVGVTYERRGTCFEARSERGVLLCGGAINTPQLLMLSGIGEGSELRKHGIRVVVDRPAVGRNLMEHPLIRMTYRVKVPTYNGIRHKTLALLKYLAQGQGPIAAPFEAIAFLKTTPAQKSPDVQLHFSPTGFDVGSGPEKGAVQMMPDPSFTVLVNKNHSVSRGRLSLAAADPTVSPVIESRLLDSHEDVETLARSVVMVRRIVASAPLSELVTEEVKPGEACSELSAIEDYVRCNTEIAYHASGTCRMGVDADAVVTPDMKVRGVENLWIADASILPDIISGNTNAVSIMIGDKLGRALSSV